MKLNKGLVSIVMVAVTSATMLVGCGNNEVEEQNDNTTVQQEQQVQEPTDESLNENYNNQVDVNDAYAIMKPIIDENFADQDYTFEMEQGELWLKVKIDPQGLVYVTQNQEVYNAWNDMVQNMVTFSGSHLEVFPNVVFNVALINEQNPDNALAYARNGVLVYDCVEEQLNN